MKSYSIKKYLASVLEPETLFQIDKFFTSSSFDRLLSDLLQKTLKNTRSLKTASAKTGVAGLIMCESFEPSASSCM
jgi:hypothetical protein